MVKQLSCPGCGGQVPIPNDSSALSATCPYCGSSIILTNRYNIRIDETYTDSAKIVESNNSVIKLSMRLNEEEVKRQHEDREKRQVFSVLLIVSLGIIIVLALNNLHKEHIGMISAGNYKDYLNTSYKTVTEELKAIGFKNINTVDLDDAGFLKKADNVTKISIKGDSEFTKSDYFWPDDPVVITYH